MSENIGTWTSLAESQKLTQSFKVPGVMEETVKRGGLLMGNYIPLGQWNGLKIEWLRENATGSADWVAPGAQLSWKSDISYTEMEAALKICYRQTPLDMYVADNYGTYNSFEARQLFANTKACLMEVEDRVIYGDTTYTSTNQPDGAHAWAALNTGTDLDIDEGEGALSLNNVRTMIDAMKFGCDILLMGFALGRRFDAMAQEANIKTGLAWGMNEIGKRVLYFDGIPIVRSDYMVAEQVNTGVGSNARAKYSSGTRQYSIFGIKFGDVVNREPGVMLGFGGKNRELGQLFKLVNFENLEDFDASGQRLVAYTNLAVGSSMGIGRIYDITDAAITA